MEEEECHDNVSRADIMYLWGHAPQPGYFMDGRMAPTTTLSPEEGVIQ